MKFIFLTGGFAGFVITAATGFLADRAPDLVLRDAAIGCLAGALLFRWFWSVVIKVFGETMELKRLAAAAEAEAQAAEKAVPVSAAAPAKTR
ncbi:MAG: hypothetical protein HS122_07695 [Opitutaceae bacterium]|nr:hypothetical protein [Opitutaceae bacterium]